MATEPLTLSVIVPARNSAQYLTSCIEALLAANPQPSEILIVNDNSTEELPGIASRPPCRVINHTNPRGSFAARNAGAAAAHGSILVFIDSDVAVPPGALDLIRRRFDDDPALAALFGRYDDHPESPVFVSQYRNLLHSFIHLTSNSRACTFWTGCGAIRHGVFGEFGGFSLDRSHLRDVELGVRITRAGLRIALDKDLQVTHLKRWSLPDMLRTDIFHRGANWTEIVLRERFMPNDLNLRRTERWSVFAIYAMLAVLFALLPGTIAPGRGGIVLALLAAAYLTLNLRFYGFLRHARGAAFTIGALPLHALYHISCGLGFLVGCCRHFFGANRPSRAAEAVERVQR